MELEATFAYDSFRPGQKELASRVYSHCLNGGTMLMEAMSGFGKTAAALCGTIAAAEETGSRIVYACRTKRQIQRVVEELSLLQRKRPLKASSLSSKFDYCLLKKATLRRVPPESFGWFCGFNVSNNLCSYFLNVALLGEQLDRQVNQVSACIPSHAELLGRSESIHVCPYELVRLAVTQAEVTVVPYHYVFDPASRPVLFDRNNLEPRSTILVVDEAHNLRDFMRGMLTSVVSLDQIEGAVKEAGALLMEEAASSLRDLKRSIAAVIGGTTNWYIDRRAFVGSLAAEHGAAWLQNLAFTLTSCSAAAWGSITYERKMPSLVLELGDFLVRLASSESAVLAKWNASLGLIEPNPVRTLPGFLDAFKSSVLLSATVNPSSMFVRSLGLEKLQPVVYKTETSSLVSVRTLIDTGVTTRYKSRSPQMYSKIADKVVSIIRAVPGGVGVFAPSYAVLGPIAEMVSGRLHGRNMIAESRGMSNEEAAGIKDTLMSQRGSVLFAVQGGRFAEGEDFRGDLMDAVAVIGLSLPPPSPMLYAEYACLKRAGEPDSYLMLSRLPALRKAFQAAGRHIREPGKRGLVFFLDHRFDVPAVRDLMPSWLSEDRQWRFPTDGNRNLGQRLLEERVTNLDNNPLRKAILAAAPWSLRRPLTRGVLEVPASSTISIVTSGSLTAKARAIQLAISASPSPILTNDRLDGTLSTRSATHEHAPLFELKVREARRSSPKKAVAPILDPGSMPTNKVLFPLDSFESI